MKTRPTKLIVNCETGEETIIDFTDEEIAEMEKRAAERLVQEQAEQAAFEAKQAAKASALAKLEALGLTEEEANALIN